MSFRGRLLTTSLVAVLVPMTALALFVRHEMTTRLTAQYERRVDAIVTVIEVDLLQRSQALGESLTFIRRAMLDDNRFRRAAIDRSPEDRRYLLDYAGEAMQITGLDMLQIQDASGRILSSGHFREEYDRLDAELPRLLARSPADVALVQARSPEGPLLCLARVDSLTMSAQRFSLVAGVRVGQPFLARLARDEYVTVSLTHPQGAINAGTVADMNDAITRRIDMPFVSVSADAFDHATFHVSHDLFELHELRSSIDRWFLVAVATAGMIAVLLVSWLASRASKPLVELAAKTAQVDLDKLDIDFASRRRDEIGVLSRVLGGMIERLRASAMQIKDAERRATQGELARQVNHDIKNGLTPIRNVFRHLVELVHDKPAEVAKVLSEREETLNSSISYLEELAANYARMSPKDKRQACDVNEVVERVVDDLQGADHVSLTADLGPRVRVEGDPVSLRRVLENLIDNAIDSLGSKPGNVVVQTAVTTDEAELARVRITVKDDGPGMTPEQSNRVFDDFYTTKADGTGLGLSIVRRLVMDLDGSIRVESEAGIGSNFVVDLPAATT